MTDARPPANRRTARRPTSEMTQWEADLELLTTDDLGGPPYWVRLGDWHVLLDGDFARSAAGALWSALYELCIDDRSQTIEWQVGETGLRTKPMRLTLLDHLDYCGPVVFEVTGSWCDDDDGEGWVVLEEADDPGPKGWARSPRVCRLVVRRGATSDELNLTDQTQT